MPRQGPRTAAQLKAHAREQRRYRAANLDQIRARDAARRAARKAIFYSGACVDCGATEELERDHIDPSTKLTEVSRLLAGELTKLQVEADKCVLRCPGCHQKRTLFQLWGRTAPLTADEHREKERAKDRRRRATDGAHINAKRRAWYAARRQAAA